MSNSSKWISYYDEDGNQVHTNMYTMQEAMQHVGWRLNRKLNTPVDKRTRFYKRMVELDLIEDGDTIYNKDVKDLIL